MSSGAYVQLVFHSAEGMPLIVDNLEYDVNLEEFAISMAHLPNINSKSSNVRIKTYRLTASNQFIHNTNYDTLESTDDSVPLLINADDIKIFPGGIKFSSNYIVCFNFRVNDLNNFAFKIVVTLFLKSKISNNYNRPYVCESFHCGRQIKSNSTGSITGVLLNDSMEYVGSIKFDYLITIPWINYSLYSDVQSFKIVPSTKTLMIGHRGSGCSNCTKFYFFHSPSKYMENTTNSFVMAEKCGAEFVELDVQLTKDKKVVVFHDFITETTVDSELSKTDIDSRIKIPVRDLNHYQLIKNKFTHSVGSDEVDLKSFIAKIDSPAEKETIFPLLSEVMAVLNPSIGMDIEIKFPQQQSTGFWELEGSYFDRTTVVECVLEEVFKYNRIFSRPIVLSSFDPGICIMLKQKQSQFPVLFLMSSVNSPSNYLDERCRDIRTAITFCLAEKLNGVCAEVDHILSHVEKITKIVHDNNLVIMTWGQGNNIPDNINRQIDCGVDGIIFDRIYDIMPTTKKYHPV